jgi:magnesium chelatase family protein
MPSNVYSDAVVGVDAYEVEIQVHAGWGNADKIAVVGLPDAAVRESKDRVNTAICNSALRYDTPMRRYQVGLSGPKTLLDTFYCGKAVTTHT